jgi:glycosyltransferase involved in cell wall biosynthesis
MKKDNKNKVMLTIPVYNEEKVLEKSILKLYKYMKNNIRYDWKIVIANNASTDRTKEIANRLTKKYKRIAAIHLPIKGRGYALKQAWTKFKSDVYSYCDVDLATDISHLKDLFDNILNGNNVVVGSRYLNDSDSKRTIDRLILSKGYICLIKLFFRTQITDFQCGFKAIDNQIAKNVLAKIKDTQWFFDTELLIRAEQSSYRIKEIPVKWNENKDTKVKKFSLICTYIKDLIRLKMDLN